MAISASLLSLKYWLHINDDENNKFFKVHQVNMKKNQVLVTKLKEMNLIGFEHVWENKGTFSKRKLIKAVKGKLLERYNFFFKKAKSGEITVKGRTLDKLRTFKTFKNNFQMENYISYNCIFIKLDKHLIFNL